MSCKSEGEFFANQNQLRFDGIYVAINKSASARPDTINGIKKPRKSLRIIRFYDSTKGIIIPESISDQSEFDTTIINRLFVWCNDFEKKNPKEKNFVNFKYSIYKKDSIRFSQISKDIIIDYAGKIGLDAISIEYVLKPGGIITSEHTLSARKLDFKFYPIINQN